MGSQNYNVLLGNFLHLDNTSNDLYHEKIYNIWIFCSGQKDNKSGNTIVFP